MKTHKRKKSSRMHGRKMGTHGFGARKQHRLGGKEGGTGMAGSGKRSDHRKTLITKLYGNSYFGKQGITSRKTERDTRQRVNVGFIQDNLESFVRQRRTPNQVGLKEDFDEKSLQGAKKTTKGWEINLKNVKVLGSGEVKDKLIINCLEASKTAIDKVKKAGGEITVKIIKEIKTPLITKPEKKDKK
jgi:large subunit ribosomal protein L15